MVETIVIMDALSQMLPGRLGQDFGRYSSKAFIIAASPGHRCYHRIFPSKRSTRVNAAVRLPPWISGASVRLVL